ncbi:DNA repair protein RadA [Phytophthora palmivora]|uniref:DNA repair protein RadA n=1 Tax=Phytophthora palmivora TaxID=4796 RepID=A0A2P4XCU2_9STRA|nr:DNA repair protein RadA [Phytophthora palmivora]
MNEVELDTFVDRIELPERELNWVLGGGLVAGSLTLVAGNPGVGKSTLALQMANMLASGPAMQERGVLYVSGEESVLQVRMRAERLGSVSDNLFVASETNLDSVFQLLEGGSGRRVDDDDYQGFGVVVVDSIQTVYAEDIPSPAGNVNQVKECTLRLLRLAKSRNVPVILIGHVTKSGDIAGPKVLEHIVDTVVQLEGDPQSPRRFLRCQKNRFGNTSEVGVFNMTDEGLQPLPNPLMAFVSSRDEDGEDYPEDTDEAEIEPLDGCSVTIAMEGKRPIPLEIQALANRAQYNVDAARSGGQTSRVRGVGVAFDKLLLLFAVLEKRARVSCRNQSVFVNIAEGYTIQEPAADLALAVALASSVLGRPVLERTAFLGEVSLSGHVRPVKMLESRLTAAQKIGLDVCVIPKEHDQTTRRALRKKFANTLTVIEVSTLLQALKIAFRSPTTSSFLSRSDEIPTTEEGSRL